MTPTTFLRWVVIAGGVSFPAFTGVVQGFVMLQHESEPQSPVVSSLNTTQSDAPEDNFNLSVQNLNNVDLLLSTLERPVYLIACPQNNLIKVLQSDKNMICISCANCPIGFKSFPVCGKRSTKKVIYMQVGCTNMGTQYQPVTGINKATVSDIKTSGEETENGTATTKMRRDNTTDNRFKFSDVLFVQLALGWVSFAMIIVACLLWALFKLYKICRMCPTCHATESVTVYTKLPLSDDTTQESRKLSDLMESTCGTFSEVCDQLDMEVKGCGNYYHVLRSFGVKHQRIKSRFEKSTGGPSAALFEYLKATKPALTVKEFIQVLQRKKIDRGDIVLTLMAFDCLSN